MKNIFSFFLISLTALLFYPFSLVEAAKEPIQIFIRENCQHCHDEQEFLKSQNIPFQTYIIQDYLNEYTRVIDTFSVMGPPLTLAGNTIFEGYDNEKFGQQILQAYEKSTEQMTFLDALQNPTLVSVNGKKASVCADGSDCVVPENRSFSIPFFGDFTIQTDTAWLRYLSSFVLGFLDGFNPCAMWVLVIFVITLMQIGDRVKMFFVAGTFLIAETIMYGFILVAWWQFFNTFSVVYSDILNIAIAILAIGSGLFFMYEGFFTDGTCKVTSADQRKKITERIRNIASSPISWASFVAILLLAFSVNVIEFACSAGYPQVFTNILNTLSAGLSEKIGLLLTYLFAYMLDDVIVFAIALISIEKIGITQQYGRIFNIVGGVLMLCIGIWMLF